MANLLEAREAPMARKTAGEAKPNPFVTVKVKKDLHMRLTVVASAQGRDIAAVLDDLVRLPLEKVYRAEVAKMARGDD